MSFHKLLEEIYKRKIIIKYLIAGGTAASVDLILLFIFTKFFGFHYLVSAVLAFSIAFFVSFFLQKFWTFKDNNIKKINTQIFKYLAVGLINLGINSVIMYVLVDIFHFWYLLAQIVAGGLVAMESFMVYRLFIFTQQTTLLEEANQEIN